MSEGRGETTKTTEPEEAEAEAEPGEAEAVAEEQGDEPEGDEPERGEEEERGGSGILGRTVGAILGVGPSREAGEADENAEEPGDRVAAGEPEKEASAGENSDEAKEERADEPATATAADHGDRIDLNRASFEELRDVGFSVTQATRVITYRERQDGFSSIDDLADVPGMPRTFLREVKGKLTV